MRTLLQISMGVLFFSTLTTSWARTWTNTGGKAIEADFVKLEDGVVHLKKGGKVYKVPLITLSENDQKFIAEQNKPVEAESVVKLPIDLKTKVSGEDLNAAEIAGKPIVIHQWQAHCGACPPSLKDYEKLARRGKKSGATYLIWHSADKVELAQEKSKSLRLKLPVYHGGMIKWDNKFGKFVWPHVLIIDAQGKIAYMGAADRTFQKTLREMTR